jgi:DNA primase
MDFAEQLKSQVDIVDVVSHYVRLKRVGAGASLTALCPFHNEKTPSFNVHSVRQFYKCFSCDAKGDLINFVMQIEGMTFWEAIKLLSERYGIPLPQRRHDNDPAAQIREALLEMHEVATRTFEDNLQSAAGADAREYLKRRGLAPETIREFRLGLAEARGSQLAQRLNKFGPELLEQSSLVMKRQDGSGWFDRFRARLMFPIHDESGKVIGFGGRALAQDDQPKYLNSSETKLYRKSSVLYNIHRAKAQARKLDRMILVEGYMDAIGVSQAGIANVVASCGTSLTNDQVRLIKRQVAHTDANAGQVIVNFDPDPGGNRGTERSIQLFLAEGLRVKILTLPGDADPDEFIQEHGKDRYLELTQYAPSYFHWLMDRSRERFDLTSAEGRASALQALWPTLERVPDKIERNSLMEELAGRFGVNVQLIRDQFRQSNPNPEKLKRIVEISSSVPPNERLLLSAMLESEEARLTVLHYFEQSGIPNLALKNVFHAMLAMHRAGAEFALMPLIDRLEPREQKIVSELSFRETSADPRSAAAQALECLRAIAVKNVEQRRATLKQSIAEAEGRGDFNEALRLALELKATDRAGRGEAASGTAS